MSTSCLNRLLFVNNNRYWTVLVAVAPLPPSGQRLKWVRSSSAAAMWRPASSSSPWRHEPPTIVTFIEFSSRSAPTRRDVMTEVRSVSIRETIWLGSFVGHVSTVMAEEAPCSRTGTELVWLEPSAAADGLSQSASPVWTKVRFQNRLPPVQLRCVWTGGALEPVRRCEPRRAPAFEQHWNRFLLALASS